MSLSIVECDIYKYFYHISVGVISIETLPSIRQRLENLHNAAIDERLDDIIWSLEYHLESEDKDTVEYFLFDYYKMPLLSIHYYTVRNGFKKSCKLHLLHENTQNTCILS
jgi:hypothetical protein